MYNFAEARQNMLDCQLLTNGIDMPELLDAFGKIPREAFLPQSRKSTAYIDEDLPVEGHGYCLEPLIQARMIQGLEPERTDAVLNIGDVTGYASAILSDLVSTVVTLESAAGVLDNARDVWDELGCCNIVVMAGAAKKGCPAHAPYDRILINGSVPAVPDSLLSQLSPQGRLVAVVTKPGQTVGRITVVEKIADGKFSSRNLFDASTFYAPGFEPESSFTF